MHPVRLADDFDLHFLQPAHPVWGASGLQLAALRIKTPFNQRTLYGVLPPSDFDFIPVLSFNQRTLYGVLRRLPSYLLSPTFNQRTLYGVLPQRK